MTFRFGIVGLLALLFFVLGMSSTRHLTPEGYDEQNRSPWDTVGMIFIAIILAVLAYYLAGLLFVAIAGVTMWAHMK
jgi:hypothetical protein